MLSRQRRRSFRLPKHWIGVQARWRLVSHRPLRCLVSFRAQAFHTGGYLIGSTGCGKTTAIHHLIARDIKLGHSVVVIDARGDLVRAALEICAGSVDPKLVRVIDLREQDHITGFCPLSGPGEPYFRALQVLDILASENESWGVLLAETLRNALLLLAEAGARLTDLERLFFDRAFRDNCLKLAESQPLIDYWGRVDASGPEKIAALASPVLNKVSLLMAPRTLRAILGHPAPFDLGKHLNSPGSILLLGLAAEEIHAAGRMFGSLMISAITREIFARLPIPEDQRNTTVLYVDEFENFGAHLFESALVEGRKYKFNVILSHQSLAQLSPKMRSLILSNVSVKMVFQVGREDCATLSRDLFGDPKAYDFAELPTGYCVLWQKNQLPLELEVNAPLLKNAGELSADGLAYLEAVYRHSDEEAAGAARKGALDVSPNHQGPTRKADLGDWL